MRVAISVAPGGGSSEVLARVVGDEMRASLGVPVLVEFKPGANQRLGPEFVAKSAPDGHTLLVASSAQTTIFPWSYKKLNYDPFKDLTPLMHGANFRLALVVSSSLPVQSVADFVRYAKGKGTVPVGSFAAGGASHFAQVILARAAGFETLHVPYKGSAPMKVELLGGSIDAAFDVDSSVAQLWRDGRLKILALSGTKRHPTLTDIPTFREQGLEQFDMTLWLAFFAPAGTPAEIVSRLSKELQRAIAVPAVQARLTQSGMEPTGGTPEQLADVMRRDLKAWGQAVKDSGFQAEE
ncbi:MAG: tripartite tricarboxylate transporter substrate binding protein [Burkholderiales bacterium]|nr:tripartite tricarboxylate transporter substrate binding protein [Burkholderiales bacterium]